MAVSSFRRPSRLVIPNVAIAAVSIKPKYIQPIEKTIAKSKDVVKDSRTLIRKAISLLIGTASKDKVNYKEETKEEIKQIHLSLQDCKTYMPNDKAHWLLANYAYQIINKEETGEDAPQLKNILNRLKPNNLIIPYAHLFFYLATGNQNDLQTLKAIISKWNPSKYSDKQKTLIRIMYNV